MKRLATEEREDRREFEGGGDGEAGETDSELDPELSYDEHRDRKVLHPPLCNANNNCCRILPHALFPPLPPRLLSLYHTFHKRNRSIRVGALSCAAELNWGLQAAASRNVFWHPPIRTPQCPDMGAAFTSKQLRLDCIFPPSQVLTWGAIIRQELAKWAAVAEAQ
eukprot:3191831-Rhodomonas_salina.2